VISTPTCKTQNAAGHDSGGGRSAEVGVHLACRPQTKFEEGRLRIDQSGDPLSRG
jgi:hypothetical protein